MFSRQNSGFYGKCAFLSGKFSVFQPKGNKSFFLKSLQKVEKKFSTLEINQKSWKFFLSVKKLNFFVYGYQFQYPSFPGVKNYSFTSKILLMDLVVLWSHWRNAKKAIGFQLPRFWSQVFSLKRSLIFFHLGLISYNSTWPNVLHWWRRGFLLASHFWYSEVSIKCYVFWCTPIFKLKYLPKNLFHFFHPGINQKPVICGGGFKYQGFSSSHQKLDEPNNPQSATVWFLSTFKRIYFWYQMSNFFHQALVGKHSPVVEDTIEK